MTTERDQSGRITGVRPSWPGEVRPLGLPELIVKARALGDDATADRLERQYIAEALFEPPNARATRPMPHGLSQDTAARHFAKQDAEQKDEPYWRVCQRMSDGRRSP